jgi:proteasome assembly chaperone (PAC2) family protein
MDFIELKTESWPELQNALLIGAFAGWNDAATSASTAVRLLVEKTDAEVFAAIDPEEFFVFSSTRPEVSVNEEGLRSLTWPANQFYLARQKPEQRPLILFLGVEPDLKWRGFGNLFLEVCRRCNVTEVMLLGAMVATVPHTRPVPLSGWSLLPERRPALEKLGAQRSRYEGPTGIVGTLLTRCQQDNLPYSSIWGVAPSYLSISPNWKVASRLLSGINQIFDLDLNLSEVQTLALRFETHVAEAVARQSDVATFVQALEENYDRGITDEDDDDDFGEGRSEDDSELPSADILIQELERQLRQQREGNNEQ